MEVANDIEWLHQLFDISAAVTSLARDCAWMRNRIRCLETQNAELRQQLAATQQNKEE